MNTTGRRTRSTKTISEDLVYSGKLQPQSLELEEAVLGALMLEHDVLDRVLEAIQADFFYKPEHQEVFKAISTLYQNTQPVDILTVTNELRKTGKLDLVGGPFFISQLTNRISSAANIEHHIRIITEKFLQRGLIRISGEIASEAFDPSRDAFELLDSAQAKIFELSENHIKRSFKGIDVVLSEAIKQIETAKNHENQLTGVPTGFTQLDRMTSGWQKSDLIILAARPAMGKTAFVLSIARNAAVDFKKPVAVFSLEMSAVQLANRLISGEAEIDQEKLRNGNLTEAEWHQLNTKINRLSSAPIYIDDTAGLSVSELKTKCRKLKKQHGIQMIIIDYLQLMRGDDGRGNGNREQEISYISRSLKMLAKELEVPVIALSQLSRAVETRGGDKRPMLSDLRESGSIEQDADMVMFLYRPEYYKLDTFADGSPTQGYAEVMIEKHRNGAVGWVKTRFLGRYAKFADAEDASYSVSGGFSDNNPFEDHNGGAGNIVIKQSRMNQMDDDDDFGPHIDPNGPAPF